MVASALRMPAPARLWREQNRAGGVALGAMVLAAAVLLAGRSVADDSRDAEFQAGLRARHLFQLAENYCTRRLEQEDYPEVGRSELAIELSVTLIDRALYAPTEEREEYWRRAWEVVDQFADRYPNHPRLLLVQTQGAIAQVTRGELGRQEAEVLADSQGRTEEARNLLRDSLRTLGELGAEVADALRERSMPGRQASETPGELTVFQLTNLQKQIQYQTARALRNQALCYPEDSPDRANALTQAVELLGGLARLDPKEPLTWPSRIDQIVCLRLLKDRAGAASQIEAAAALKPSGTSAERLISERIRLALAGGQLDAAIGEANQVRRLSIPELDFARLETALAAWRAAQASAQPGVADQWQKAAVGLAEQISQAHGPYWSRRAQLLVASSLKSSPGGGSVEMWAHAAESAYLGGQFDEALTTYDEAATLARQQNDAERAFQYAFLAATIERQRGRHAEALARYRTLANGHAGNAQAAEAHRLAIQESAVLAQTGADGTFEAYVDLLGEHLQHWPTGATADSARWQLARVRQSESKWGEAIALYQQIAPDSARFPEAAEAVARCYRGRLEQARGAGEAVAPIAAEAARWFETLFLSADGRPPQRWSPLAQQAVLDAAEFWLLDTAQGFDRAESILVAALRGASDAPETWQSAAQSLRVGALAGQGRRPEAAAVLEQVSGGSTDRLLGVLDSLARLGGDADPAVRAELARLQLETVELVRGQAGQLSAEQKLTLEQLSARALRDAGQTAAALAAYEQLAAQHPDEGDVQEELAAMLAQAEDRRSAQRALDLWRNVETRSAEASPRWFRAKYSIALLHCRLGNPEQARKMIALLQLLHPEMGGREMKAQFEALLKRCGG
ncbi:MAG: tetratricopeptide repeat protein [Thermoguttaceae bacterium]